jgi:hypothetical protein
MDQNATFNEKEIQQVLARAAELQAAASDASSEPSLTLEEVEQAAENAGLDPSHVRQAVRELSGPKTTHVSTDANDTYLFMERWVDRPMSEDTWQAVVAELRHRTGLCHRTDAQHGWSLNAPFEWSTTERIGDIREWTHHRLGNTQEMRVSLSPRGEQTQLRLAKRTPISGNPLLSAMSSAAMAALFVGLSVGTGGWALVVGLVTGLVGTPAIYAGLKAWRRFQFRSLDTLAGQLEKVLIDVPPTASETNPSADRSPPNQRHTSEWTSPDATFASVGNGRARPRTRGSV